MNFSEVVIFDSAQILPCYILHLAPSARGARGMTAAPTLASLGAWTFPPSTEAKFAAAMGLPAAVGTVSTALGAIGGGGAPAAASGGALMSSAAAAMPGGVAGLSSAPASGADRAALAAKRQREKEAEAEEVRRAVAASHAAAAVREADAKRAEEADIARAIAASLQTAAAARKSWQR
jgi:hypothetical protein